MDFSVFHHKTKFSLDTSTRMGELERMVVESTGLSTCIFYLYVELSGLAMMQWILGNLISVELREIRNVTLWLKGFAAIHWKIDRWYRIPHTIFYRLLKRYHIWMDSNRVWVWIDRNPCNEHNLISTIFMTLMFFDSVATLHKFNT